MPATIYFSGSISSGRGDVEVYRRIVSSVREAGYEVISGSVTSTDVGSEGDSLGPAAIFERDLGWVAEADILLAEVSLPSTGVGYEIASARYHFGIPVVCLWRPAWTKRCTAMVSGDPGIEVLEYTDETFEAMLARLRAVLERVSATAGSRAR